MIVSAVCAARESDVRKNKNILNTKDTKGKPFVFIRITSCTLCPSWLNLFRLVRVRINVVKYIDFLDDRQYTVASFSPVYKNIASTLPWFVNHLPQGTHPNVCWNANIERV